MAKSRGHFETMDEYVAEFPENVREILEELRRVVRGLAPKAQETMDYGMPTFKLKGNLVHFAAYKNHIGFYPTPSAIEAFKIELAPFKQSKGTVQFSFDKPIPFDLVKKFVKFRVRENEKRAHGGLVWK